MIKSQEKPKKIHFIGIGGIGVSALARYYLARGAQVSGSDVAESEIIEELRRLGAKIPPSPPFAKGGEVPDLVVYSAAVEENNLELVEARARGIKCQIYAQALGELTKKYFTIAVSGTHGKSTTTAMIGLILEAAGLNPTVIVGTKVRWNEPHPNPLLGKEREKVLSNFRLGHSKYLVIEADEYSASILNYWPKIIVLTNIEEDHLDYYRNLKHIMETFAEYIFHLGKDGALVVNGEDENARKIAAATKCKVVYYSSSESREAGRVEKLNKVGVLDGAPPNCGARRSNNNLPELDLKIPGKHNLSNVAAAMAVAKLLKIPDKISIKTLNNFSGTWRRMEYKGKVNGAKIYDDYGHHPTEIKATLQGARELLFKRAERVENLKTNFSTSSRFAGLRSKNKRRENLWCVFQPHQFQRTYQLFDKFANAFGDADKVILLPIYSVAGREKEEIKKKVSSQMLALCLKAQSKPKEVIYLNDFNAAKEYLMKNLKKDDICVIMGAGDIYKLTEILLKS